jgi:hypothetical protein
VKYQPKDVVLIRPIQDLNGTIPNKMKSQPAREKISKCGSGKVAPAEIGKMGVLGTAEPCRMVENKERVRSAVGLLQCSWRRMMVPRRVGIETRGDPGCPERLAQTSRSRGELVSLGSAGSVWSGGWRRCEQQLVCAFVF